jgi:GTPase SAR1 family protein
MSSREGCFGNHLHNCDGDDVDRISILIRGAFNVGKTSLCSAFTEALDHLESKSKFHKNTRPNIEATSYGVYSKRINVRSLKSFNPNSKELSIFKDSHGVIVNLIDTAGFDTNIGRLPNSMIRDIDAVMLLFSCDLKEDTLRSCQVAYSALLSSNQLSSAINRGPREDIHREYIFRDTAIGDKEQTKQFPIFTLVGTKGDLVIFDKKNQEDVAISTDIIDLPSNLNEIKDYWASISKYEDPYAANQYERLIELETRISRDTNFFMVPTEFTSASCGVVGGKNVLKTFYALIIKVLETRVSLREQSIDDRKTNERDTVEKSNTTTSHISDLNSELRRVNKKTTNSSTTSNKDVINLRGERKIQSYGSLDNNMRTNRGGTGGGFTLGDNFLSKVFIPDDNGDNKEECC